MTWQGLRRTMLGTVLLVGCASGAPKMDPAPAGSPSTGAASSTELTGTRWLLSRLGTRTMISFTGDRAPQLVFSGSDRRVTGSGGCDRLTGPYMVDGTMMRLGPIAGTMMMCQQLIMEQERALLQALEATESYRIEGDQLELRGTDRQLLARFVKGK